MGLGGGVFPLKDNIHRDFFPSLGNSGKVLAVNSAYESGCSREMAGCIGAAAPGQPRPRSKAPRFALA